MSECGRTMSGRVTYEETEVVVSKRDSKDFQLEEIVSDEMKRHSANDKSQRKRKEAGTVHLRRSSDGGRRSADDQAVAVSRIRWGVPTQGVIEAYCGEW